MSSEIQMHDLVALLADIPAKHFVTGEPVLLRRGLLGTAVMTYDGTAYEVEFAGSDGRAYAIVPVPAEKLLRVHESPINAAA
ncbi:MAG: DUF4926 domain-containing protein [Verrucomicrobiota bacterium]|nr:DUF4926 domain-containing protein [Verrucomicrobiota bacterium]